MLAVNDGDLCVMGVNVERDVIGWTDGLLLAHFYKCLK